MPSIGSTIIATSLACLSLSHLAAAASEFRLLSGVCQHLPGSFPDNNNEAFVGDVNLRPAGTGLFIDDLTGNGFGGIPESARFSLPWYSLALHNATDVARYRIQCSDRGGLAIPGNPSRPLRVNTFHQGTLVFDSYGLIPEPYALYVDGQRQPGVYLGAAGVTRWAWSQVTNNGLLYWKPRLLVSPDDRPGQGALREGEVEGYLVAKPY
ncbi:hypothetical protein OQA88_8626 [Cercophora sp. LCS_1]